MTGMQGSEQVTVFIVHCSGCDVEMKFDTASGAQAWWVIHCFVHDIMGDTVYGHCHMEEVLCVEFSLN